MSEYALPLDKLLPALIKFQAECPAIPKDKENTFITEKNKGKKAMYADLATITEKIKTPLSANGLAITQPICGSVLQTYLYHASGQFIKAEIALTVDGKTAQQIGSEITYMRRYLLCSILGIAADDDDDGNGATPKEQANTQANKNNPTPANPAPKNPCSEAQQRRIETLWQELGRTEAALKKELQKTFKVDSVSLLGVTEAVAVIKSLDDLVVKKNAEKKQTDGATAGATESTPA